MVNNFGRLSPTGRRFGSKDDENGYGPKGKNFIAHVDIPETVYDAFEQLQAVYGNITREANPEYASK